jgi:DNA-binding LytR/AlgR family response regulator
MDIELADGQSFEIFSNVDIKCPVIFTTAYDEFALKEFKVNSVDYLLKPIKKDELESAINKWRLFTASSWSGEENTSNIKELIENLISGQTKGYKSKFLIKSGHRLVPISTDEIAYFYTEEKVVFIRTTNNARYMTDYILEDLETILDPAIFFRANRQYIINSKCVHNIEQWFNGKLKVKVQPPAPEDVIISREKAPEFKTWIAS